VLARAYGTLKVPPENIITMWSFSSVFSGFFPLFLEFCDLFEVVIIHKMIQPNLARKYNFK
jgi:hypothetical protein